LSIKKNVIANYAGQGWSALMSIAFVPLYIRYIGIEAYGLVGLFAVIQVWLGLLDVGMSPALNREMARYVAGAKDIRSTRNLLRTLEVIAGVIGLIVVIIVCLSANWITTQWVKLDHLSLEEARHSVMIMSIAIGARWVAGLYRSALTGLQCQVSLNALVIIFATIRGVGVLGVLEWMSPSVVGFFAFQAIVSVLEMLALACMTRAYLAPSSHQIRFEMNELRAIWRFALGVTAISFLALLLTQIDKVLLSSLLPLKEFGYYTLATSVAGVLAMITGPLPTVYFPKFSELVAKNDNQELTRVFHQSAQLVCLTLLPAAAILAVFSYELMFVWVGDSHTAETTAPIITLIALGTLLNGYMVMPYFMQLAHAQTRLVIVANTIAVVVLVPAIIFVVPYWGGVGAAACWLTLNICYMSLLSKFVFRKIMINEMKSWYLNDVIFPSVTVLAAAGCMRILFLAFHGLTRYQLFLFLLLSVVIVSLVAIASTPLGRSLVRRYWAHMRLAR
jgi:O-antigen/teichoic acid export membrane protein